MRHCRISQKPPADILVLLSMHEDSLIFILSRRYWRRNESVENIILHSLVVEDIHSKYTYNYTTVYARKRFFVKIHNMTNAVAYTKYQGKTNMGFLRPILKAILESKKFPTSRYNGQHFTYIILTKCDYQILVTKICYGGRTAILHLSKLFSKHHCTEQ